MRYLLGGVLVLLAVILVFHVNWKTEGEFASRGDLSASASSKEFREFLRGEIDRTDPDTAYEVFKEVNSQKSRGEQHLAAHVMGDVLFQEMGADGIAICDPSFGFGCFHGFFVSALSTEGDRIIEDLDAACIERFGELGTGCQHGIGHGVLEFSGHENIALALERCKDTTQVVSLLGCTSGVFMEYNTPMILGEETSVRPRPLEEGRQYGVCEDMSGRERQSCFYELGGWWHAAGNRDYLEMGAWCDALGEDDRIFCYLGVGNLIPPTHGYDEVQSMEACDELASRSQALCRSGASWAFYANPERRVHADSVCVKNLSTQQQELCTAYNRLDLWR